MITYIVQEFITMADESLRKLFWKTQRLVHHNMSLASLIQVKSIAPDPVRVRCFVEGRLYNATFVGYILYVEAQLQ